MRCKALLDQIIPTPKSVNMEEGVTNVPQFTVYPCWWDASLAFLNPFKVEPTENVLGWSLAAWECTFEQSISRIMENLPALSEKTWNIDSIKTPETFCEPLYKTMLLLSLLVQEE